MAFPLNEPLPIRARPMISFAGKVVLVTGSTQGLGEGIATRFARAGAKVALNGRSPEKGVRVLDTLRALGADAAFIRADLSTRGEAERLVREAAQHFGRLDILINNAQIVPPLAKAFDAATDDYLTTALDSGLRASLWTSRCAFAFMQTAGAGRIVNFASINGAFGSKYGVAYNAAKEAIRGLTRTLANELGPYHITVNVVLPAGWSPAYESFYQGDRKKIEAVARLNPMRRHGRAEEDIGAAVVGLCADNSRFITGQSLYIDGGANLNGLPQLHSLESSA